MPRTLYKSNYPKISRNISEKNFGKFRDVFRKITKIIPEIFDNYFRKFSRNIWRKSKNFERQFGNFQKSLRKTSKIISKNFENRVISKKLFRKISRNILECSRNITETFEKYFENFQNKFLNISRIISKNFRRFQEIRRTFSISIFRKILRSISKNIENYSSNFG